MADNTIEIQVNGLDKVLASMSALEKNINTDLGAAGQEAATEILDTVGLRSYPDETKANQPPTPYYVRGRGMERAGIRKPQYNDNSSQKYGANWYVTTAYNITTIGNKVTYAPYLAGDEQAAAMAKIGWRKLWDVAQEKIQVITEIYQGWIDRFIRIHGL